MALTVGNQKGQALTELVFSLPLIFLIITGLTIVMSAKIRAHIDTMSTYKVVVSESMFNLKDRAEWRENRNSRLQEEVISNSLNAERNNVERYKSMPGGFKRVTTTAIKSDSRCEPSFNSNSKSLTTCAKPSAYENKGSLFLENLFDWHSKHNVKFITGFKDVTRSLKDRKSDEGKFIRSSYLSRFPKDVAGMGKPRWSQMDNFNRDCLFNLLADDTCSPGIKIGSLTIILSEEIAVSALAQGAACVASYGTACAAVQTGLERVYKVAEAVQRARLSLNKVKFAKKAAKLSINAASF